ncbi:MAG TPA: AsmA-like C-terminal region-containing protein [Verrucomicrobiae bacterium]|nr:AsmA-like C-terminal region-containing protein [Verrucomicrobiae bacterium]
MGHPHHRPFWRLCFLCFRRCRIALWFLIFLLLASIIYLNQVGLPSWISRPLVQRLQARGLDLQFSRLRLRFYQGFVADNVRFGQAGQPLSPHLLVNEVRLLLNFRALAHLHFQIDALVLQRGQLTWPLPDYPPDNALSVQHIQTYLRFLPNDQWALDDFSASFAGAHIQLSGIITNASALRHWKVLHPAGHARPSLEVWPNRLRRLAETLDRIHFSASPELRLDLSGDARSPESFTARIALTAPGADTPWGAVSQGRFTAKLFPADTNGSLRAQLNLEAAQAKSRWAAITNFALLIHLVSLPGSTNLVTADLRLSADQAHTQWAQGTNALFTAQWVHSITNPVPLSGQGHFQCGFVQSRWGSAAQLDFSGSMDRLLSTNLPPASDPAWGLWTNLQPFLLDWRCHLSDFQSPKIVVDEITCAGKWRAPLLTITNLEARLYQGSLNAHAGLNVASRLAHASLSSDFDPHKIHALLTEGGRRFLQPLAWDQPPRLSADLALTLPAWTNLQPDWRAEIRPSFQIHGQFSLEHGGSFNTIPVASARSHFAYSNLSWSLPDLTLTRPEGRIEALLHASDLTHDFYWHFSSSIDPRILRPLLDQPQQRAFDLISFSQPPLLDAEVWGRFHDPQRTGFKARVALTNFSLRGASATSLQTALQYTNRVLQCLAPLVQLGPQLLRADGLAADFNVHLVYLTNGFSTADPLLVARAIGPHIARAIEPYHFDHPPVAHVHGIIPMEGEEGADLEFDLDGGPFHWWKLASPHITGHVHWAGLQLALSGVRADFYDGAAWGSANFRFHPNQPAALQFSLSATNALLQFLAADLSPGTNHLEGRLSGNLSVTQGDTENWQSVFGYGSLDLRDGVIWDIPLFGIFSPVLNGIAPGLGSSRATAATCTFVATNGVLRSDDLEIRSPPVRLDYRGTVDLQSRLNARVEAALLRDMWLVGPIVSTVFWPVTKMFEYKVTGTLHDPKSEPVFILPKLMLLPFHPLRGLKGLLPEEPGLSHTNSPPPP